MKKERREERRTKEREGGGEKEGNASCVPQEALVPLSEGLPEC